MVNSLQRQGGYIGKIAFKLYFPWNFYVVMCIKPVNALMYLRGENIKAFSFPGYHVSNIYSNLIFRYGLYCSLRLSKTQCSSIGFHISLMDQGWILGSECLTVQREPWHLWIVKKPLSLINHSPVLAFDVICWCAVF
jgi:hypothetical protein